MIKVYFFPGSFSVLIPAGFFTLVLATESVLQVVFSMIDKVVRLRLSEAARAKCEKNRKKTPSAKAKEQSDQQEQEQLEKLRKEAEAEKAKLKNMTPEQRKKYEEKKRK